MKIKKQILNNKDKVDLTFALYAIGIIGFFTVIILMLIIKSGISLKEMFGLLPYIFQNADGALKVIFVCMSIIIAASLLILVLSLKKYISKGSTEKRYGEIDYINLQDSGFTIGFVGSEYKKTYSYNKLQKFELIIETYDSQKALIMLKPIIQSIEINFKINEKEYNIQKSIATFMDVYKIIYYSQYINNFSYDYSGFGYQSKAKLEESIKEYIHNNYKKTPIMYFYILIGPITYLIIAAIILIGIIFLFQS